MEQTKSNGNGNGNGKLIKWDGAVNLGGILQMVILVISIVWAWGVFDKRLTVIELQQDENAKRLQLIDLRTERLEFYISSHDPEYYKSVIGFAGQK